MLYPCFRVEWSGAALHRLRLRFLAVFLVVSGILFSASSTAAEVDSVTTRRIHLDDSAKAVNFIFNQRLLEAVEKANVDVSDIGRTDTHEFCDEDRLYSELRKAIFQSFIPSWGLRGYDLDLQLRDLLTETSYSLSLQDSVYRDIGYLDGFSLNVKELSDVIRIDGHLVGLDKLGHFFAEGWAYFEQTRSEGKTLVETVRWGSLQESGKFGYTTTGIYSFADLVANFNGWNFWNTIRAKHDAPLKGVIGNLLQEPYVECEFQLLASLKHRKIVRVWRLDRRLDISDYVDGAWDEGNNCNSYENPMIEAKVDARVDEIFPEFNCPVAPEECRIAQRKYEKYSKYLLHPRCLMVMTE